MYPEICLVGLDLGTTTIKAMAYTPAGELFASRSAVVNTETGPDGRAVQDPNEVAGAAVEVLRDLAGEIAQQECVIAALGMSAAMHSLVALDDRGAPLVPAMTWMDARPADVAHALWASPEGPQLYARTGTPIHAMAPVCKLAWMRQTMPAEFAKARRFASLKEYVWHHLFREWVCDPAMASATGLFDVRALDWDEAALEFAGIRRDQLSRVVPAEWSRPLSSCRLARCLPLAEGAQAVLGGSDGVLATLAAGAKEREMLVVTIGTSLAVRAASRKAATNDRLRTFCYALGEGAYVLGAPSNAGGVAIDWLVQTLLGRPGEIEPLLAAAGEVQPDDLVALPYVAGERAPFWDERMSAAWVGLRLHHGPAHMVRAAVEGVLFHMRWLVEEMRDLAGGTRGVMLAGRLFEQPWIAETAAALLPVPVWMQPDGDGATYGAAMVAGKQIGVDLPPLAVVPGPQAQAEQRAEVERRYAEWRKWVDKLRR
ncbi:gluconokinase [Alicyclobacillus vulcanalis]|uniref:Gluconate kinase, FGGY family n=1 Tax=Alicyclobacillus vulcanalis TaxID=252246 RepID=A0A1N7LI12_9BACL|nr:gluconokinase [Alicyclobacillus vulcanalis]SIS73424.1 gluconate kinase, FGGY family [Alicyclobacillus vulcanalis]